ncbi:MAG: hypothetical protein DCC88_06145 [Spirobacillus cienkowskii]|jgi:hypothetical protein|uniref:Uncharacterized protein n=1 Tax=Spirobacillus cienkowskii TaxID=495820 RepID=A0A369KU75_9BACT|nr:MAG: hypothetical protein DCC88_06145 [Spirobacillus cienkowskii]
MTTESHSSVYEKIKFFQRVNSLKEFLSTEKNSSNYKNKRIQKIETLTLILDKIEQKIKENKKFIS